MPVSGRRERRGHRHRRRRLGPLVAVAISALVATTACRDAGPFAARAATAVDVAAADRAGFASPPLPPVPPVPGASGLSLPAAPGSFPTGPLPEGLASRLDRITDDAALLVPDGVDTGDRARLMAVIDEVGRAGDVRAAWVLVDLLQFEQRSELGGPLIDAVERLVGTDLDAEVAWVAEANLLLAWDVPAPPGYLRWKRRVFVARDPGWAAFFLADASIDWRQVTWDGTARDGITSLTDPALVKKGAGQSRSAATAGGSGAWPDATVVIGVVVGGEARAYPRALLEAHHVVNDHLGGRALAVTFCPVCRTAVPFVTAASPGTATSPDGRSLRSSGLLLRSNQLLYDRATDSLISQLTGTALSGPLAAAGVVLPPLDATVTTWKAWRAAHPSSSIVAAPEGRSPADLLAASPTPALAEATAPIFPVGRVDDRLPPLTVVLGVVAADGTAWCFPRDAAVKALVAGREPVGGEVHLALGAAGMAEARANGAPATVRQLSWFAWSGLHPDTGVWSAPSGAIGG